MRYLILGAGPAGLAFANSLLDKGQDNFIVLEAETEAGGLCRSKEVDGASLDIGGGHFLDVRRPKVNEFLFKFMPADEWNLYKRDSRIAVGTDCTREYAGGVHVNEQDRAGTDTNKMAQPSGFKQNRGGYIGHPFEANIWQLGIDAQVEYLKSIAQAGCNTGKAMPEDFVEWIYWKLGERIADDYMLPYNSKMFGDNLNQLGTYWLNKLPNVSFDETLRSCLEHKPYGTQPGHAEFYYPKKYGYGELWLRMADALGTRIEYGKQVYSIDFDKHVVRTSDGAEYKADKIITTIPWTEFEKLYGMPEDIRKSLGRLKHSSVQIGYFSDMLDTKAQWIYFPDPKLSYHRILVRSNFLEKSPGYWTETNVERLNLEKNAPLYKYVNKYAYPLNTKDKPDVMNRLLKWSEGKQVYGLGRWGEHQHYNSDLTVELAMRLADKLA